MLTSDQTARSHPALHLGVITATLSKPRPGRGRQLRCGCSGTRRSSPGAPRPSPVLNPEGSGSSEFAAEGVCLFVCSGLRESKSGAFRRRGHSPTHAAPHSPRPSTRFISARFLPAHSLTALSSKINIEPGRFPPYVLAGRN